jgi:hypothetical protein
MTNRSTNIIVLYSFAASLSSSVLLVALAFVDHDTRYVAVGLLIAINPIQSLSRSGYGVSALDFAPRYGNYSAKAVREVVLPVQCNRILCCYCKYCFKSLILKCGQEFLV